MYMMVQGYRIEWRLGGIAAQSFRGGLREDWDGNEAQASYFPNWTLERADERIGKGARLDGGRDLREGSAHDHIPSLQAFI